MSNSTSSSSTSYVTAPSVPSPSPTASEDTKNAKETAASLTVSEFTTLVSSALEYNPIIEPLALPCRPESHFFSIPCTQIGRPMKPGEKVTVLRKIKSILLRDAPPMTEEESSSQVPKVPRLPLPPPSDPLFTPHIPLPLALERGLVNSAPELPASQNVPDTASENGDSEDRESDFCYPHASQSEAPSSSASDVSDSVSSSSCSGESLSRTSSSLDLTSDPADPFAKGCVQVVRQSTESSSSCSLVCSLGAYSLGNHPYATNRDTFITEASPKKAKRKRALGQPPLPPPSLPLPLPPRSAVRISNLSSGPMPLPPLLPMPTGPLPPTPRLPSQKASTPRGPTQDWTLDLPHKPTAFDLCKRLDVGTNGVSGMSRETGARRRRVSTLSQGAKQNALQRSAAPNPPRMLISAVDETRLSDMRPGQRRKGSPFPLPLESPPPVPLSPLSTTSAPPVTGVTTHSGSSQRLRAIRPHTLTLSPSGLPISPRNCGIQELGVPVSPISPISPTSPTSTCTSSESASEPLTPLDGRTHIPGWFIDERDSPEEGYKNVTIEHSKTDVEERYWTAPESIRMHYY